MSYAFVEVRYHGGHSPRVASLPSKEKLDEFIELQERSSNVAGYSIYEHVRSADKETNWVHTANPRFV